MESSIAVTHAACTSSKCASGSELTQRAPPLNVHQGLSLRRSALDPEHQPLGFLPLFLIVKEEAGKGVMFGSEGAPSDQTSVTMCSVMPS